MRTTLDPHGRPMFLSPLHRFRRRLPRGGFRLCRAVLGEEYGDERGAEGEQPGGAGFGETIRSLNGALECDGGNPGSVAARVERYERITGIVEVAPGAGLTC